MGNLQFVGDAASVLNVLAGATGALAADRLAMIVELKRDPHDVVAFRLHEGGDDGGNRPRRTWRQRRGSRPEGL